MTLGYCAADNGANLPASNGATDGASGSVTARPAAVMAAAAEPPPNPFPPARLRTPWREPHHPFMADEASDVSVSVGNVTNGYLINAKLLPIPAKTYAVLPRQRARGLLYTSDEMVGLLEDAAEQVSARHDRLMWIGNLGRRGGGDTAWSVSHNSGRDADIAFCYTDPSGKPVDPPDLLHVDDAGVSLAHDGQYRFDPACTWTIVRSMLLHKGTQIQYLFIANSLKRELLRHARSRRESSELIELADAVLGQPGMALPHNDHLHVRIYCSRKDMEGGCVNNGKVHPWVDVMEEARAKKIQSVGKALTASDFEQRARARERLVLLRAHSWLPRIARGLDDDVPRVRVASALAVGSLGGQRDVDRLVKRFEVEQEPEVKMALLESMKTLGGSKVGGMLEAVIASSDAENATFGPIPAQIRESYQRPEAAVTDPLDLSVSEAKFAGFELDLSERENNLRLAAIEIAAESERPEPVPALVEVLSHPDPLLRARAARALHLLTNHSFDVRWDDPDLSDEARQQGVSAWRQWLETYGSKPRDVWLAAGMSARGYQVPRIHKRHVWELVRAITDVDFLSYNAQQLLARLSDHRPKSLEWPRRDAAWHWTRWFERRRARFGLPSCPPELATFNR